MKALYIKALQSWPLSPYMNLTPTLFMVIFFHIFLTEPIFMKMLSQKK